MTIIKPVFMSWLTDKHDEIIEVSIFDGVDRTIADGKLQSKLEMADVLINELRRLNDETKNDHMQLIIMSGYPSEIIKLLKLASTAIELPAARLMTLNMLCTAHGLAITQLSRWNDRVITPMLLSDIFYSHFTVSVKDKDLGTFTFKRTEDSLKLF